MKKWKCSKCQYEWTGDASVCDMCLEIGYEVENTDVLDALEIVSIDSVLEEIEGKDEEPYWRF